MKAHIAGLLLLSVSVVYCVDWDVHTALDDYVHRIDPHYRWFEVQRIETDDFTVHHINMTSQMWMDYDFTQEPIWWHWLSIFVPKEAQITDAAYMFITGGSIGSGSVNPPGLNAAHMRRVGDMCKNLGVVSAHLTYVPFQPQHFTNSPNRGRLEDQIIAGTWKIFVEDPGEPNPDVVALVPMTKAAKQALDTIQNVMKENYPDNYDIVKFMPAGISKRGWVTWLLSCVDRRIFALAPIVMDLLNMQENLEHHYRSLGGWSWAFAPYYVEDVPKYLYHERFKELESVQDPLYFKERLTMPKFLISATGDQFFLPDDSHVFFQDLLGEKFIMLCENDDHGLSSYIEKIQLQLQAFFLAAYRGIPLPRITWTREDLQTERKGILRVQTSPSVLSISAWMADSTRVSCEFDFRNSTCRRDFRLMAVKGATGVEFVNSEVTQTGVDQYMVEFPYQEEWGFRAFFIEMTFAGPAGYTHRFTTELHIIPDIFPYEKCETEQQCRGILV